MLRNVLTYSIALLACGLMAAETTQAQCAGCGSDSVIGSLGIGGRLAGRTGGRLGKLMSRPSASGAIYDADGMTQTTTEFAGRAAVKGAIQDHFTPHRAYAYSNHGITAGNIHEWNGQQQDVYAWHGGYQNWRWGTPTALVVPPNASYGSSYAWGVGQVRSTPIHHQFGRGGRANVGGPSGEGAFSNTPYWPSSTDQFGVYSVRAPW
jgi:hypothetical protein